MALRPTNKLVTICQAHKLLLTPRRMADAALQPPQKLEDPPNSLTHHVCLVPILHPALVRTSSRQSTRTGSAVDNPTWLCLAGALVLAATASCCRNQRLWLHPRGHLRRLQAGWRVSGLLSSCAPRRRSGCRDIGCPLPLPQAQQAPGWEAGASNGGAGRGSGSETHWIRSRQPHLAVPCRRPRPPCGCKSVGDFFFKYILLSKDLVNKLGMMRNLPRPDVLRLFKAEDTNQDKENDETFLACKRKLLRANACQNMYWPSRRRT